MTTRYTIVQTSPLELQTSGLAPCLSDLRVSFGRPELLDLAREMLATIAEFQIANNSPIRSGEKIAHGDWLVQANEASSGVLKLGQSSTDGSRFEGGVECLLAAQKRQRDLCEKFGVAYTPARADQMIACSVDVMEDGMPVYGVRYPAPNHMSGWYLYTDNFDGDVSKLQLDHLYHLIEKRPDLRQYLALPPGHRFVHGEDREHIEFDPEVR